MQNRYTIQVWKANLQREKEWLKNGDSIIVKRNDSRMETRSFHSPVGSSLYVATITRPEIALAVCQLSRHLKRPSEDHCNVAIGVLHNLKSTFTCGIIYRSKFKVLEMIAFSDTDWGSNKVNRLSTSGVMVIINNSPAIFKSKL